MGFSFSIILLLHFSLTGQHPLDAGRVGKGSVSQKNPFRNVDTPFRNGINHYFLTLFRQTPPCAARPRRR